MVLESGEEQRAGSSRPITSSESRSRFLGLVQEWLFRLLPLFPFFGSGVEGRDQVSGFDAELVVKPVYRQ